MTTEKNEDIPVFGKREKSKPAPVETNVSELSSAIAAGVQAALEQSAGKSEAKIQEETASELAASKLRMKNSQGKMLMCELTLQRRKDAPDPQCVTVNEERYYLPRGVKAIVPWYFVQHLMLNVQRDFRTEKVDGKPVLKAEDVLAEVFSFREIDPAPDNPPFQQPVMISE